MTAKPLRHPSYDAVVVGARCAGSATAMLLARSGLRVLAIDRARYGTDTLSTHALMRGGVLQLHRWGVLDAIRRAGTPVVRSTSFHYGTDTIRVEIKPRDGVDGLYAPRRTLLDATLADAAVEAGAELVHGVRVVDLLRGREGRVSGVVLEDAAGRRTRVEAGIVIGADGIHSTVARLAGAETIHAGTHAAASVYAYWSGFAVEGYHWHYGPGVAAGTIPTNDGRTCVFVGVPRDRFLGETRFDLEAGYHRILAECAPSLAAFVAMGRRAGGFHGFAGETGYLRRSRGPGWALVGDAGYFRDPITAHGITDALRDAEILARAVAARTDEALVDYERSRNDVARTILDLSDAVASFSWDLESVRDVHLALSDAMKRGVGAIAGFDGTGTTPARRGDDRAA